MIDHVSRLREPAQQQECERLHFIGHSFGGVITFKLLESTHDLPPGRAVFLGSPFARQSRYASHVAMDLGSRRSG
jgi:alpha-beta hydrolase superfamily lysophospholipase